MYIRYLWNPVLYIRLKPVNIEPKLNLAILCIRSGHFQNRYHKFRTLFCFILQITGQTKLSLSRTSQFMRSSQLFIARSSQISTIRHIESTFLGSHIPTSSQLFTQDESNSTTKALTAGSHQRLNKFTLDFTCSTLPHL